MANFIILDITQNDCGIIFSNKMYVFLCKNINVNS